MKPKSFMVCIYEVRELVWGESFDDSYATSVTMSDGSTREIKLTPVVIGNEAKMQYSIDGHVFYMNRTSTYVCGDGEVQKALMVKSLEVPSDAAGAMASAK